MEKYKFVQVISHPRSGSHYLTALIAKNFFKTNDYLRFYGGHGFNFKIMRERVKNKNQTLFIYIWRNFEDVAKSIFKLRARFGLNVSDLKIFKNTPYSKMWTNKIPVKVLRKTLTTEKVFETVDPLFREIDKIPKEFHRLHFNFWSTIYADYNNVIIISYDDLKNNYIKILDILSSILHIQHSSINITDKIGWQLIE